VSSLGGCKFQCKASSRFNGQSFEDSARGCGLLVGGLREGWGGGGGAGGEAPFTRDLPSQDARSAALLARLFHPGAPARSLPLPLAGITTASQIKPRKAAFILLRTIPPLGSFSRQASEKPSPSGSTRGCRAAAKAQQWRPLREAQLGGPRPRRPLYYKGLVGGDWRENLFSFTSALCFGISGGALVESWGRGRRLSLQPGTPAIGCKQSKSAA
jgi:hypothetical protein